VDFVNLMAYDLHGSWNNKTGLHSALHSMDGINVALSAKIWLDGGMPKEKIVIGVPAYGRGWRLQSESHVSNVGSPASGIPEHCTYRQLCEKLTGNNARRTFHQVEQCPSLVCNGEWYGYDDKESVTRKMEWLKAEGYAGAFIWSMDQDDYDGKYSNGEQYPLMKTIKNKLG